MPAAPALRTFAIAAPAGVLLAWAATALAGYHFGIDDQAQYLVQVVAREHPGIFASDPYTGVFRRLGSIFWPLVAAVSTEASRPAVCLGLALAISTLDALLLVAIGLTLLGTAERSAPRPRHAAIAALALPLAFVRMKEANWFGLVGLADVELTATSAVMPLVLLTILLQARGRTWWALLAATVAVPIHGQTGGWLLAASWLVALRSARANRPALVALAAIGVAAGAALALDITRDATAGVGRAEHLRVGLGLYPQLVDPSRAPWTAWAGVAAVVCMGAAAARSWRRTEPGPPAPERRLALWALASCAAPLAGIAMIAVRVPVPIVVHKLMPGRGLMLVQIAALILVALWSVRAMARGGSRAWAGAIVLLAVTLWPFPLPSALLTAACLGGLVLLVALAPARGSNPIDAAGWMRSAAGSSLAMLAVTVAAAVAFAGRPWPWLGSGQDRDWLAVQRWARDRSPEGATFITPPYLAGWRVGSHRPTFGEVQDGGLSFYAPALALGWARRMECLGMGWPYFWLEQGAVIGGRDREHPPPSLDDLRRAYRDALETNLESIVARYEIAYVVTESARDVETGPVVWSGHGFVVRAVER